MMLLMILLTAERHFIYSTVNLSNVQLIRGCSQATQVGTGNEGGHAGGPITFHLR